MKSPLQICGGLFLFKKVLLYDRDTANVLMCFVVVIF
jgi:hypothetical protein